MGENFGSGDFPELHPGRKRKRGGKNFTNPSFDRLFARESGQKKRKRARA